MSSSEELSSLLNKIFLPIILGLGIFGNLVSMLIFAKKSLKKYTTFRFLFLLSLVDICVLLTGCGDILLQVYFNFNIRLLNEYFCKIHSFMVIFFTHSSSMILLFMSVDRAIVISIVRRNQTTKVTATKSNTNTNKIFLFIFALIALLNIHFLLFNHLIYTEGNGGGGGTTNVSSAASISASSASSSSSSSSSLFNNNGTSNESFGGVSNDSRMILVCHADDTYYFTYLTKYFPWVDTFFYVMFPSAVMLICSIIIISKIIYTNGRLGSYGSKAFRKRTLRNKQISYLLLTTNFLFFFMVSPLLVLNLSASIQDNTIMTTIVYLLAYSNHSFNFIFYGISCEKYRYELFKLVKKLICLGQRQLPVTEVTHVCNTTGRRQTATAAACV